MYNWDHRVILGLLRTEGTQFLLSYVETFLYIKGKRKNHSEPNGRPNGSYESRPYNFTRFNPGSLFLFRLKNPIDKVPKISFLYLLKNCKMTSPSSLFLNRSLNRVINSDTCTDPVQNINREPKLFSQLSIILSKVQVTSIPFFIIGTLYPPIHRSSVIRHHREFETG